MNEANIGINNSAYNKHLYQWFHYRLLLFITIAIVSVLLLQWRYSSLNTLHNTHQQFKKSYQEIYSKKEDNQRIECSYAKLQQQVVSLGVWREHCFVVQCLDNLAPLLSDDLRFERLLSDQPNQLLITGRARAAQEVFSFMEVLKFQDWLEQALLVSLHKDTVSTMDEVIFSIRLKKKVS